MQPDSFFGASGGQRVDTAEAGATGSSMVYSPSQLDAAGDVDPVAEADVYLAYGRDLQAEEILKEALRINPQRVAIHAKLLEIYAKRRDAKAFEVVAAEAYSLTRGAGPEWDHICELGQELDRANPAVPPRRPARPALRLPRPPRRRRCRAGARHSATQPHRLLAPSAPADRRPGPRLFPRTTSRHAAAAPCRPLPLRASPAAVEPDGCAARPRRA